MFLNKLVGCIRFNFHARINRNITFNGRKQYLGRFARLITSNNGKIMLGNKTYLSERSSLGAHNEGVLEIGNNNFFNSNVNIICYKNIHIGDNNLFAQNVVVVDQNHRFENCQELICRQGFKCKKVTIGSDCWICANVVICPGAEIPDHCVIAANSVVTCKLFERGVYAGSPARLMRKLK